MPETKPMCESLQQIPDDEFYVVNEVVSRKLGHIPIAKGDFHLLPTKVQRFIAEKCELMRPRGIFICDGTQHEADEIINKLIERGMLTKLKKLKNCYICRTDPKDVARVEGKTWMVTPDKYETMCHTANGVQPEIGHWMSPDDFNVELDSRFPGCMAGRMMYVIPFSMGPIGSPLSKIGIQLTDSNYVVLCMRIMTRVSLRVFDELGDNDFVRGIHSVGLPRPVASKVINHWPCNPDRVLIAHRPAEKEIWSFGSGYGGNSLLGKKCFALRIAGCLARDEGWLAEHMLIMGITREADNKEHFIAAAFPSQCGKTNMAMLQPSIPGYKVRVVGDDIAWMRFNKDGQLVAINPEAGFFGVAPGTSMKTNPMAMASFQENSIFTNVAETEDGMYFWEGLEDEIKDKNVQMTNWLGEPWKIGQPGLSSHSNSRFTAPASQCPIIHPKWEDPAGVHIEAIIFGGRRPEGVPLIFESFNWAHGVYAGASVKSETTSAAEFSGKSIMHDPMAMRPFMGYNFGKYLQHWLDMEKPPHKVPKIFHVNWFRQVNGKYVWPGFGENIRVLDWVLRRIGGDESIAVASPVGYLPVKDSINTTGLNVKWDDLFSLPKDYWQADAVENRAWMEKQVGPDLPQAIRTEMEKQEERIAKM
jgi:phosphoenolpyruvate carboxykinase (GTP)